VGPHRHDEFIDQDVKDVLNDAIRQGMTLRDQKKHTECYSLYVSSCQSASALLPVDSDHRGRLQLSLARAESMSHDRACAILRYAMDDVLRSGLRATRTPLPHISQRADVVLHRPPPVGIVMNTTGSNAASGTLLYATTGSSTGIVQQSTDEALNSLILEMKEMLDAPIYHETPLPEVANRFWIALDDMKKHHVKHAEKLEHHLGQLKGDFLLARAVCVPLCPYVYIMYIYRWMYSRNVVCLCRFGKCTHLETFYFFPNFLLGLRIYFLGMGRKVCTSTRRYGKVQERI
jgi:hypothetical protein